MENVIIEGAGELDGTLDCTPPMASLSPSSFDTVIQDVQHTFGNIWEVTKSRASDDGQIEIDGYLIDAGNMEDTEGTQAEEHPEPPKYAVPSAASSSGQIPATSVFKGYCGFDVTCFSQIKAAKKSIRWTYNENRRKLFANMGVVCPFCISVTRPPPEGTVVRVMAVYAQPDDAMDVVKRCLVHTEIDKDKHGQNAPCDHLIRCVNPATQYHEDKSTGRHSIIVPYEKPEAEMRYTVYHLRFMCLSSCSTGIDRRGVKLVWTLENNGSIIGRQVIDLKLCASPVRDRKKEEKISSREMNSSLRGGVIGGSVTHPVDKRPSRLSANTTFSQTRPQKRGLTSVATVTTGGITGAPAKVRKTEQEREGEYIIKCSNKKIYTILKLIHDSLLVHSKVNPDALKRTLRIMHGDKHVSVKSEPKDNPSSGESQE